MLQALQRASIIVTEVLFFRFAFWTVFIFICVHFLCLCLSLSLYLFCLFVCLSIYLSPTHSRTHVNTHTHTGQWQRFDILNSARKKKKENVIVSQSLFCSCCSTMILPWYCLLWSDCALNVIEKKSMMMLCRVVCHSAVNPQLLFDVSCSFSFSFFLFVKVCFKVLYQVLFCFYCVSV